MCVKSIWTYDLKYELLTGFNFSNIFLQKVLILSPIEVSPMPSHKWPAGHDLFTHFFNSIWRWAHRKRALII
jgi:hypothetical protein